MALGSRLTLVVTCLTLVPGPCRAQNDCFTSSSIVGAVLGTFFSTAIALALLVFLLWWIYYRRSPNGADRQSKGSRAVESGSGFDNPCFEANPNSDVVDGSKTDDYNGRKDARSTSWTPLRFFGTNKNEKKRSMDDSFISEPERVSVQLRGHDFTGLGFSMTGNMRDGIFIKDISNRGPAFESGKIAPGDRILNVTISFRHVVYEDALTILSYASPYDVTMELEKGVRNSSSTLKKRKAASTVSLASASPSVTLSATAGSVQPEGPQNERLVHPLYRSQSIDDLSKVGRADTIVSADLRIPNLSGQLGGNLAKSKLLGKANLEIEVPDIKIKGGVSKPSANVVLDAGDISVAPPDVSLATDSRPSKISKFAIKVLPDFKFKGSTKSADLGMTQLPTGLNVPEAELNLPKVEIHVPKASDLAVDIDVPDGSAVNLPKPNVSMAIDMPEQEFPVAMAGNIDTDIKLNIEAPSISVSAPVGLSELKLKEPTISQPSVDLALPAANLDLELKSPSLQLPDVAVGQDIPNPEVSVDLNKAVKSGFHIKFPKFGGSTKSAKVDVPEVSVNIATPEVDVALPEANLESDLKLKKEGSKAGFEFKMPKLSLKKKPEVSIDAKAPIVSTQIPDVKLPEASLEVKPPVLTASAPDIDVQLPSASVEVKKPKMGFSMPKFNMGKNQGEPKESINVAVDVPSAQIDLPQLTASLSDDDEAEGGKKKLKFGKMPKIGKPEAQINVSVPDISADVEVPSAQLDVDIEKPDVKTKNIFGFKLPKVGASATVPDVNLDVDASVDHDVKLPNVDVKLPSVDVKVKTNDTSSSSSEEEEDVEEGGKKKKRFNIKMPKFGLPKADIDVNAPSIAVDGNVNVPDVKPIEGNVEIGVPNLSADVLRMHSDSSEESDSDDEGKKKKKSSKSLKVKAPEIQLSGGINTPTIALPSLALPPIAVADVSAAEKAIEIDASSMSLSAPVVSSEIKLKEFKISQPSMDVSLPTTSANANVDIDIKSPGLPDVTVGQDIPNPEVSIDVNKAVKSGFHIKFPKFGGSKTAKVDTPEVAVNIPAPEVDVALPEASLEIDPKLKKDGAKAGFEFKMPKLSLKKKPEVSIDARAPTVNAQIPEVDVDVKMPGASIEVQPVTLAASGPDVELPSASLEVKKPKMGFSMPKFHMGKSPVEPKESINVAIDAPSAQIDLPQVSALSDDDEAEGGKKKMKFGKMKFGMNKPQAQVSVSVPDVSAEVEVPSAQVEVGDIEKPDVKTKHKFGFKLPKIGGSASVPDVDVDASVEPVAVKLPKVEIKADTSDSSSSSSDDDDTEEGRKKKKKFNIKLPKFGSPKAEIDVNSPSVAVEAINVNVPDIKPIEGNLEIKAPKVSLKTSSHSDDSDSDDEKERKKKGSIGLAVEGIAIDADAKVAVDADLSVAKKKGSKFGIKFPKLHADKPRVKADIDVHSDSDTSSDDDDEGKGKGITIAIPSVDLSKPDASVELPSAQLDIGVKQPKVDLETETGDHDTDDDETKKKSSKFGFSIKMPKFHMKKKSSTNIDIDLDKEVLTQLHVDATSAETDEDPSSEDNLDKKKGKVSVKLPKFGMKKPEMDADLGLDKTVDVRADVKMPKAEIDLPELEIDVKDGDKEKSSFSIKMPELSVEKPKLEMNLDSNNGAEGFGKLNVDTGKMDLSKSVDLSIGGQVQPPSASFGVAIPTANLELPDVEVEVEHDDLDDEKKKSSKFFKMPKFHMGRHHGEFKVDHGAKVSLPEKGDAELNLPSTKLEFDSNVSIDLPSKDDVDSDDEKKDKKKPRFGIKLPKFQMKQPQVSGGVEIKPEDISLNAKLPQLPSVEANVGAGLEGSISADSASVDMEIPKVPDVVSPIDVDVAVPDVKVEMSEKDGKKKGKFSFKSNFKMPKLHMSSGKGHAELEAPSAEISLPKVELDSSSRGETDEDFDVDIEKKKSGSKFGAGFKMPKMRKPTADGDVDVDVSLPTLNVEVKGDAKSDDSSDDEDKESEKKKSGGFAFKMPKLNISSGKSEIDLPEIDPQLNVKAPSLELEEPNLEANIDLPEGELSKKSPFIVKMPALSPMKPSIDLDVSTTKHASSSDSSSSDSEDEKSKKGFKLGFKMPQLSMSGKSEVDLDADIKVAKTELDLPSVDTEVSLPEAHLTTKKKSSFGSHFKMPSFSTKTNVGVGDVELPDIDIETPRMEIQEEGQVAGGAEDESEKKGQKIGIKLPKFQMRQRDADVPLPQVELKTEDSSSSSSSSDEESEKELKVKVKKPKFGIKLPEFNKPKLDNELPKKDLGVAINVQSPTLAADLISDIDLPQASMEIKQPSASADISNVDIQVGNIDAEVAKVKAQLAQLQAEFDIQSGKQSAKKAEDDSSSSSSDSETERRTKSSGLNFGLKMPKFSLGKEKLETEAKLDVAMPSLTTKNNGDEMTSPSLSSLEVEPVKLESGPVLEKEKKKFSLGLKMPKFPSKTGTAVVENEVGASSDAVAETKPFKVSVKGPKMKLKKKKGDHRQSSSSDSSSEEENNDEEDPPRSKDASGQLMGVEVKLPRVQVYKNVEYQDAEKGHNDSSSDEEDEVKDIKKNIGARFGVKLKKPKMFSSNKVEITGKSDPGNNSSTLQPEWKLPRVDLRRASKSSDQELSVDVDLDLISEQQKLEQLSPSERAEAIRRDSKSSAGIRLHSPSYISLMPSPRSKKPSLETLDVESSPKLLSVTRLDPTPPIETSATMQQPMYGNIELTTTVTGPQVSASQVPSSVIMASDAVKMKRGPPTPARRSIVDPNSSVFQVAHSVITTDVTVEGVISSVVSEDISSEMEINLPEPTFTSDNNQQASDTDISISTSTGSDTLVISCVSPSSSSSQQEAHNRKASSLGDLTRIPTSGSEDGSLERTVSLDFKPVSTLAGNSSRAIYNLAVQDLSRVGEDSDEDYNLNRKRPTSDHGSLEGEVTVITVDEVDAQSSLSSAGMSGGNRTLLTINTDDNNVTLRPLEDAEALWFGSTSIQTVESVQTTMSYTQMEESISTDVTLTTTSLGTSPSETSSSSSSEGSPFSPASPEPSGENTPNLVEHSQVENGRTQQYHTEMTELAEGELGMGGTRTITLEMTSLSDDSQPQPLTDLNPSAGNFAAVRNRFEQLSGTSPLNGAETTGSLGRNSGRLSQTQGTVIKRLSGNFEELPPSSVNVLQKSFMQHIAPELSEGALSRTVIISSLTLERAEQNSVSPTTGLGPESPVPNLEPPC